LDGFCLLKNQTVTFFVLDFVQSQTHKNQPQINRMTQPTNEAQRNKYETTLPQIIPFNKTLIFLKVGKTNLTLLSYIELGKNLL
jgi:hypothetical protein